MQIKLTHNNPTNVTLSISADAETLNKIKQATVKRLGKNTKVAGFREGKAPMEVIEKNLDQNTLQSEFIDATLNHFYVEAITKENLRVIGQPSVNLKKFVPFTTFDFEITADVLGEVKLADYSKISKTKPSVKVTAKDVNGVLESLRTRSAEKKPSDKPAKDGDEISIDFKGSDSKGEPVNGAEGKDYPLVLGSNTFIPGFEENLIGLKAKEKKKFTLTFPKSYQVKALQNKKVTFDITVKAVNQLILPKLDDQFAAKAGPFKTLEELKKNIKQQLEIEQQTEVDRKFENELLQEIAKKTTVAIPKAVIDDQIKRIEENEKQNLIYRGQTWQEHLEAEGQTAEQHSESKRPEAEEQVKIGIIIGAIGDKEKINVTPEELEVRMQLLKGQYQDPKMQAELDSDQGRQDIASRLRSEKIVQKLVDIVTKKKS